MLLFFCDARAITIANDEQKIENPHPVMYAVVSGDYSEYKIVPLCSSEESAVAKCEAKNELGNGYDVRHRLTGHGDGSEVIMRCCI